MSALPGFQFNLSGATGSQALLSPKDGWRAFVLPEGGFASQDSAGTLITFDSAAIASRFAVGNWIQAGLPTANIRQVGAVGGNSLNVSGAALSITKNDRIFLFGSTEPTVSGGSATYTTPNTLVRQRDDTAADLYTNSMITTDSQGLVRGFASPALYDVLIQDGNHTNQGYIADFEVGSVRGVSAVDRAYFGQTVTMTQGLSVTGPSTFGNTVTMTVGPDNVRHTQGFLAGSSTNGIQEAIDDLKGVPGYVMCAAGVTFSNTKKVWLHSGVTLLLNGSTLLRAAGSIANGNSQASGDVIGAGPYGSNGTQFDSGTQGNNIAIIGPGYINGNSTAHSALTDTNLGLAGGRFLWVNNLTIVNVDVQDTLQDGWYISNCSGIKGAVWGMARVGQWGVTSSRNGFSLMNNDNSSVNMNSGAIAGIVMKSVGDEAITGSGIQGMVVSGIEVDGCDFGIEFTAASSVPCKNCSFSGGAFQNVLDYCITFNATAADCTNMSFSNLAFDCHPTLHDGGVIYMSSSAHNVLDVSYDTIKATNVNSKDTTARDWVSIQAGTLGKTRQRLTFSRMNFVGLSSSTRTGDVGFNIRGAVSDLTIAKSYLKYVPGIGYSMDDSGADLQRNFDVGLTVDTCNYNGFQLRNNTAAAWIDEIGFNSCKAIDCARMQAGSNAGWFVQAAFAGSTISNVHWSGCRSYKSPSATGSTGHLFGINFQQSAGTIDQMNIEDGCDFSRTQSAWFGYSGTLGVVRFRAPAGRGTDIASASTIQIPPDGDSFHLTGTTTVNTITVNPWDYGRLVTLINDSTAQVANSGNQKLSAAGPNTSLDTLTIRGDSSVWFEAGRSVN